MRLSLRKSDVVCLLLLVGMVTVMVYGAVVAHAQTQDFYNGTFSTGLRDVSDRVARVEGRLDYILGGLLMSLLAQIIQIATHVKTRQQRNLVNED